MSATPDPGSAPVPSATLEKTRNPAITLESQKKGEQTQCLVPGPAAAHKRGERLSPSIKLSDLAENFIRRMENPLKIVII